MKTTKEQRHAWRSLYMRRKAYERGRRDEHEELASDDWMGEDQ